MRRYTFVIMFFLTATVNADSWLGEGARELENLRMRQLQTVQIGKNIADFASDGCSGGQSQGWEVFAEIIPGFEQQFSDRPPWETCCVAHDREYWRGLAIDGYRLRKNADVELRQCVLDTGLQLSSKLSERFSVSEKNVKQAFSLTADLMYRAVRLGGQPCSLLPWRWGYGWDRCAFAPVNPGLEEKGQGSGLES